MATIYIVSDYGVLVKRGETLQLIKDGTVLKTIFPFRTEQLVISGKVELTSQALRLLMFHQIDTVFIGKNGKYAGKLLFEKGKNVFQRRKQYQNLENPDFCVSFSRSIVAGKLRNQLNFIQRLGRRHQRSDAYQSAVSQIKQLQSSLEQADSIQTIRGLEGMVAKTYFSVYRNAIQCDWTQFTKRSMNPPLDPVNAVLSFLYTLILYRVDAAIEVAGLDGYVGYLHALDYGKKTLAFDLMEEYRTALSDALTTGLFNMGTLQPEDFRTVDFSQDDVEFPYDPSEPLHGENLEKPGVLLTKEGLAKVINTFEKKMETSFNYPPLSRKILYRDLFDAQIKHFRRVIMGEEAEYKPYSLNA